MKSSIGKRITAILSSVCMIMCFIPMIGGMAFAAEADAVAGEIDGGFGASFDERVISSSDEAAVEAEDEEVVTQDGDAEIEAEDFETVATEGANPQNRLLLVGKVKVLDGQKTYYNGKLSSTTIKCGTGGYVKYNSDTNTLTLYKATIKGCNWTVGTNIYVCSSIYYESANTNDPLYIEVKGTNTLDATGIMYGYTSCPLADLSDADDGIVITGSSSASKLYCKGTKSNNGAAYGIHTSKMSLNSVKVYATAGKAQTGSTSFGVKVNSYLQLSNNAYLSGKSGIVSSSDTSVGVDVNCNVNVPKGSTLKGSVSSKYKMARAFGVAIGGYLTNSGTVSGYTTSAAKPQNAMGIYASQYIKTYSGSKTTGSTGSATESNFGVATALGNSTSFGGTVTAKAGKASASPSNSWGLYIQDNGNPTLAGGKVTASSNGGQAISNYPQVSALYGAKKSTYYSGKNAKYVSSFGDLSFIQGRYVQWIPATVTASSIAYTADGTVPAPKVSVKLGTTTAAADKQYTTPAKPGYNYSVKLAGKANTSGKPGTVGSKTVTYKLLPSGISIGSVVAGSKSATVNWSVPTQTFQGRDGFDIRYSTKSSMSGAKTIESIGWAESSYKITGLTKGKTYYVQIRTKHFATDGWLNSPWSKAVKVTAK